METLHHLCHAMPLHPVCDCEPALAASICGETSISLPLLVPHRRLDDLDHLAPSGCGPFSAGPLDCPLRFGSAASPPILLLCVLASTALNGLQGHHGHFCI